MREGALPRDHHEGGAFGALDILLSNLSALTARRPDVAGANH